MSNIKLTGAEVKKTDKEIKKAIECCIDSNGANCRKCPYDDCCSYPKSIMLEDALDLINRYEEKNSNLTSDLSSLQNDLTSAKAEVERLKTAFENSQKTTKYWHKKCGELAEEIQIAKAEAYKECIEKVKEHSNKTELVCSGALVSTDYTITEESLDSLLNEFERKENTAYDD